MLQSGRGILLIVQRGQIASGDSATALSGSTGTSWHRCQPADDAVVKVGHREAHQPLLNLTGRAGCGVDGVSVMRDLVVVRMAHINQQNFVFAN